MKLTRYACVVGLTGALFIAGGCWSSEPSSTSIVVPVEPNPPPTIETSTTQRVQDVASRLDDFDRHAQRLPGSAESDHRAVMETVFGDFIGILPLLEGPDEDAAFRQQLRLIDSTRDQLAALASDLPSEPLIATGLRAVYNALQDMFTQQFSDQTRMSNSLNTLEDNLDELDTAHDAANRQIVSDAVHLISGIMRQMDAILSQRLELAREAASQPSTQPTTQPSTQP